MPAQKIKRVGGEKNAHGTRVVRKVKCGECGNLDFISFVPGQGKRAFCKPCAEKLCNAIEFGQAAKSRTVIKKCPSCKKDFEIAAEKLDYIQEQKKRIRLKDPEQANKPLLCSDCYSGFEIWTSDRAHMPKVKRTSGHLLRSSR